MQTSTLAEGTVKQIVRKYLEILNVISVHDLRGIAEELFSNLLKNVILQ